MKRWLISLMLCGATAHAYQSEPVIPKYDTQDYAVYVYYVGDTDDGQQATHLFGSDGQYCHVQMTGGKYSTVGGSWEQRDNGIHVSYHAPKRTFFALWNDWHSYSSPVIDIQKLVNAQGFDGEPFLMGFGNGTPQTLAVFDAKIHTVHQPIPTGATHVFVGENNKTKDGYALTAFSLENMAKINTDKQENAYVLSLASTPNTLSDDDIRQLPNNFEIRNGALILGELPTFVFISNDTNTDVISISHTLNECQGTNPLNSLKRYYQDFSKTPQEKAILPFLEPHHQLIYHQGDVDEGAWLKRP